MEEVVKELLQINRQLTETIVELSKELAGVRNAPLQLPEPAFERVYMTEAEEDEEFRRENDPMYGVDPKEVAELLQLTGFDNPQIETV